MCFMVSACATNQPPKTVYVEVWTSPEITKPERPILVSDGQGTDGEVARKLSIDLMNMEEYMLKLENILNAIKSSIKKPQMSDNNK